MGLLSDYKTHRSILVMIITNILRGDDLVTNDGAP